MKNLKLKFILVIAALGLAAQAQAAVFTENVSVAPTTSTSVSFTFAQFNPALGTLTSVDLILTPTVAIGYDVFNASSSQQTVISAGVSSPSVSLVNTALGLGGSWSSTQTLSSPGSFIANPGFNPGPVLGFNFGITPSSVTVDPAGFTGSGTYSLSLTGSAIATSEGTGSVPLFFGFYAEYGGSLEVDYNYSSPFVAVPSVPESTWTTNCAGFAALGMLGVVTFRRKFPRLS
jgi:hypothetical protein